MAFTIVSSTATAKKRVLLKDKHGGSTSHRAIQAIINVYPDKNIRVIF